jgi:catechol 2,3-dioxygenase-like lactoylglutathione lyase family enzyme
MISKTHIIFYVEDQSLSTGFYKRFLGYEPVLNVPGMTEFRLSENTILGLMPVSGIKKLLSDSIPDLDDRESILKAELYLVVDNISVAFERAVGAGAKVLSGILDRDWGHKAAYFSDPDNYIIAFAEEIHK